MAEEIPSWASPTPTSSEIPSWASEETKPEEKSSGTKAFAKSAVESTIPSVAALAAFTPGAVTGASIAAPLAAISGPAAPIVEGIGALLGGVGASLVAGYATGKVQEAVAETIPAWAKKASGFDVSTRSKETKEHPISSFAGQLAPNLLTFRPGALETVKLAGKDFTPWAQRSLLAAGGAGMEAGQQAIHGEKLDPTKIAMSAVFMGVAAKPTKLGEKIMSLRSPKVVTDPGSKEWTTKDLKEKWELPKELNGVPVKDGVVKQEPHKNSIRETAFRNKETGEIIPSGSRHDPALKDAVVPLEQGFLTHGGEFKNRYEAAALAYEHHLKDLKSPIDFEGKPGAKPSETREPGLHSTDFGPEGVSNIKAPEGIATHPDGSPILARHYRNADGSSREIILNKDAIVEAWVNKPWTKPKVEGVHPLAPDTFKTPGDLVQFYALHEEAHTMTSRPSWVSKADHENLVNEMAMEKFNESNVGRQSPDVGVPEVPRTEQEFADSLFSLGKNKEHDNVLSSQRLQAAEQEGVNLAMKEKWQAFAEGTPGVKLEGKELDLFNKYYVAEQLERRALIQHAQDKGWILPTEMDADVAGLNASRELNRQDMSGWEKFKKTLTDPGAGGFDQGIDRVPGGAQERGIFIAEFPNGKRVVVQAKDNRLLQWSGNKATVFQHGNKYIKAGDKVGAATIKEARISEIEKHTPFRYNKDSQAVLYKRLIELREFNRANEFLENLKGSEYLKENSVPLEAGKNPPEGYQVLKNSEKVPQLRGLAFKPRVAEIIDDFSKTWTPNALTMASGALIKNMMLNPLPHMLNEAWHVYNARGITGWITPAGIGRFVRTGIPSIREVMIQGPEFRSMLKDGASLLSADVRNSAIQQSFMQKGSKEFIESPEGAALAKEYGMSLGDLYDKISKKSSIAMWTVRDAMYVQMIKEKMQYEGLTQKEAITEVERHLPSYRIKARVGEKLLGGTLSRGLSKTLQNPNVSVFSRYHYGMVNSLIETAKDLGAIRHGKAGLKQFGHGVDTAVAIGIAMSVLYPLQDMLAAKLTGNPNAEQRRAGPYHIFDAIQKIMEDKKDGQAVLAAVFTFNPILLMAGQLLINRKLYNGQQVYHPGSVAPDLEKYFFGQVPQMQSTLQVSDEKTGGGVKEWTAKQLDIKSPTEEKVRRMDKIQRRNKRAAENRKRRREYAS